MHGASGCFTHLSLWGNEGQCWLINNYSDGRPAYAIHWEPPPDLVYKWKNTSPKVPKSLRIYEAHVGISGSEPKVSSFNDFTDKVLPCIKEAGYNAIQLIGVVEHKDYFTVGYRVTNFFAVSSRYGTPDDFKRLVDEAHGKCKDRNASGKVDPRIQKSILRARK